MDGREPGEADRRRELTPHNPGRFPTMTATATLPSLSAEQRAAADHLLRRLGSVPVQTLGGYAGCGKTVLVAHLHASTPDFGVCAFTGKAADILRRKGLPAATIHSIIYRPVQTSRGVAWRLKAPEELGYRGFVIDEASMVARPLFDDLRSFGYPIVAVGDHGQLPPVGEDAGLMRNPDVRLETIHRNAGPIARFAEHLRKGNDAEAWRADGEAVRLTTRGGVGTADLTAADQIVCAFNRTRVGLNRTLRRLLGRPAGDTPVTGDRVMCLRNSREVGVFNGQQGTVGRIDTRHREMEFVPSHGEPVVVSYHPDGWNAEKAPQIEPGQPPGRNIPFDFAYAVTAHKFQGDEADRVIVYEERCQLWEHSRWAYTAASRAKESLIWVLA